MDGYDGHDDHHDNHDHEDDHDHDHDVKMLSMSHQMFMILSKLTLKMRFHRKHRKGLFY